MGVDPSPFTFWELATMAEARSRDEWGRTSALLWIVAESKRDKKKRARPFTPAEFNPWETTSNGGPKTPGKRLTVGLLLALRGMFERMGDSGT